MEELINFGKWSPEKIDSILHKASRLSRAGEISDFISRQFLNVHYRGSTLIGSSVEPEVFVVNLEAVDCFTLVDYVEAMRLSKSFDEFIIFLKKIRYQGGIVKFKQRNHFFINWRQYNADFVEDVTTIVGRSEQVSENLNDRADGTYYLPGVSCNRLTIDYISSKHIDDAINKLKIGDYIGIYSDKAGLDVSHVGIFIRDNDRTFLRHASQKHQKVIDEDFKKYVKNKPGILVLRPKNQE